MHRHTTQPNGGLIQNRAVESSMPQIADVHKASPSYSLESNVQSSAASRPRDGYPSTAPSRTRSYAKPTSPATSVMPGMTSQRQEASGRADDTSPSDNHSVHAIIGATGDERHREGFFGSSSAETFMQTVKKMVEQKLGRAQQSMPAGLSQRYDDPPLLVPGHEFPQKEVDYVLPPRTKADNLMASY